MLTGATNEIPGASVVSLDGQFNATVAYATLSAMPLLGGRALRRNGNDVVAAASVALGVAAGVSLALSAVSESRSGLFQRIGLTLGDVWIVSSALDDPSIEWAP